MLGPRAMVSPAAKHTCKWLCPSSWKGWTPPLSWHEVSKTMWEGQSWGEVLAATHRAVKIAWLPSNTHSSFLYWNVETSLNS